MNYIYFNDKRRLKDKNIDDLYATSSLADVIYIFADFDTALETDYSVSLMFRRSDGMLIGEVECLREPALVLNPSTNTEMPAFSFVLESDVLGVEGSLQITARYYKTFVDDEDNIEDMCLATGMIVATVYDAVPNYTAMKSTVAANLNRKIVAIENNTDELREDVERIDVSVATLGTLAFTQGQDINALKGKFDAEGKLKLEHFSEILKTGMKPVGYISKVTSTYALFNVLQSAVGIDANVQRGCYFIAYIDADEVAVTISEGHNIKIADDGKIGQSPEMGDLILENNDLLVYLGKVDGTHQWMVINNAYPTADETEAGVIKLSTNAQALVGTDDTTAMTPAKVKSVIDVTLGDINSALTAVLGVYIDDNN